MYINIIAPGDNRSNSVQEQYFALIRVTLREINISLPEEFIPFRTCLLHWMPHISNKKFNYDTSLSFLTLFLRIYEITNELLFLLPKIEAALQ